MGKINEDKVPGVDITNSVSTEAAKQNKAAMKDVESKMKDYDGEIKRDDFDAPKRELSKQEEEVKSAIEHSGGMEDLVYDLGPDEKFKDRQEKAIKGDSTMGNAQGSNEEYGNTEATWDASDNELGQKMVDAAKKRAQLKNDAKLSLTSMGDDIEVTGKPVKNKKIAVESTNKMKKLTFKKPFNGKHNALELIPENYKVDNKVFVMTDGNETYKIKWDGSINEGKAIVIKGEDKTKLNESLNKMKSLMGYNSSNDSVGRPLNEHLVFHALTNKTRNYLNEGLSSKETQILQDILGEAGMMDEAVNFENLKAKVLKYAKKGLLTMSLITALFTSMDGYSQEQKASLADEIENATGIRFSDEYANKYFEFDVPSKQMPKPAKLDFDKYGQFGDKYVETLKTNYVTNPNSKDIIGLEYHVSINHHGYKNTDFIKKIVGYNKGKTVTDPNTGEKLPIMVKFYYKGSPLTGKTIKL